MTSSPSPSTENKCSDVVTDAANLSKFRDIEHVDDDNVEDEEGDMDFNPFLKEAPSVEASSSLSSEIEEFEADVVESREPDSPVLNVVKGPDELQDEVVENVDYSQTVMQTDDTTSCDANTVTDFTFEDSQKIIGDSDDEDAIWRRTRARYSLVGSTLDELETFLQETDDEDDHHHNINDEEEYRKFLTAVLQDGGSTSGAAQENENVDEDEEDNDADFELELEEALESDDEKHNVSQKQEHVHVGRRPETRQKKRQKTDARQNKFSGHSNRPLVPIFPCAPIFPKSNNFIVSSTPNPNNDHPNAFTPQQIGQLYSLMYEHLQLLVQVFSLSILEPSRQDIASQVHTLLLEMLKKRDQVVASQRVSYPRFCFDMPYIRSAVTMEDGFFWVPFVSNTVLSVIDVAPLNLVQSYLDDVSVAAQEHQRKKLQLTYDDLSVDKEGLFPCESFNSSAEPSIDNASEPRSTKTIAGALAERSKTQSIALVPKAIAKLALRFFPLFNPSLFPHKPPPLSVANRVLFTDSEDGLLARGLMRYNNDWNEIQKNFLPCKTPHQIFVRQKNRSCSKAPENPIKAVRRMKTSPLTPYEIAQIEEGLKVYKLDWMDVWKYMVPYRDPSLLARQWRTAVGNQKSYKGDEYSKAKRRLYEQRRRQSKLEGQTTGAGQNRKGWSTEEDVNPLPDFPRSRTFSDKENCSTDNAGGENNSGDEGGNNEDEAYVHEAFLADWRPDPSSLSTNLGEHRPLELFTQDRLTNPQLPANNLRYSAPKLKMRPYRARKSSYSQLVKLAPDLPPVNLPPTVRVMSQSAFTKYQNASSDKAKQNAAISHPRASQRDERNSVEKNDSDLHLHPLLFQEDGNSLPYYPLNATAGSSSSFDFFPNNSSPQLNLNLFQYSDQGKHTLNFFSNSIKSKELNSSLTNVDFHPLLQRTDEGPSIPEPSADLSAPSRTNISGVPRSPNELDLDIRLSSTTRKENNRSGRVESIIIETQTSSSHGLVEENVNYPDSVAGSLGVRNDEIVMEQEELSDSEDEEIEESVEFECEEMTDSEGEVESDSDHVENIQNEDMQNDSLPKVSAQDNESDRDEPRIHESSTSNTINEINEPRIQESSTSGPSSKTKFPVTRNSRSSSKKINLSQPQVDAEIPIKKPRNRAQKPDSKR